MRRLAVAACLAVAAADVVQPLILPWVPKMFGALAGGVIYAAVAVGIARGLRWPAWIAVVMPVIPIAVLIASAAGIALPVQPDTATKLVLGVQLVAAAACGWMLRRE